MTPRPRPAARPYDAVVFDLDGTLVDTTSLHIAATRAATEAVFGVAAGAPLVRHSLGRPLPESMSVVSAGRGHEPELLIAFMTYYLAHEDEGSRCFPAVARTLDTLLAGGLRLALLSNKLRRWGREEIDRLDLARRFALAVFLEDMPEPKPSSRALQPMLRAFALPAARLLIIGDSVADLRCGQGAGAGTAAALWGAIDPAGLRAAQPDHLFERIEDIPPLLLAE